MKNITLSADASLIDEAHRRAKAQNTTLNAQFRLWLSDYVKSGQQAERAMRTVRELAGKLSVGRTLTRNDMNQR